MQDKFWHDLQTAIQRELDDNDNPIMAIRICSAIRGLIVQAAFDGTAAKIAADMYRDKLEN
jgi:hypothetical protein